MNSKRRAELQRKLSMSAVPRPPAGLSERIKADIPKYLQGEQERERFTRSIAFNMRLAASILLLISTAFAVLYVMTPGSNQEVASTTLPAEVEAELAKETTATTSVGQAAGTGVMNQASADSVQQTPAAVTQVADARPASVSPQRTRMFMEDASQEVAVRAERAETGAETGVSGGIIGGVAGGSPGGVVAAPAPPPPPPPAPAPEYEVATVPPPSARETAEELITVTAEAPVVDVRSSAAMTTAPAPVPPPAASSAAGARTERSLVRDDRATAKLAESKKRSPFGISVDPQVFHRIKETIESGRRPAAGVVDVEALVNYFAGAPSSAPRRGLRLEVEASPAAVEAAGEHAVLRFTIDTPQRALPPGTAAPAAAKDVRIVLNVNPAVVKSVKRIGDLDPIANESVLPENLSVTALYALELKSGLRANERVATVRVQYTSVQDGKKHTSEKIVHGHDLARSWTRSSRRHRLASLGALWAESLKGAATGVDVARRATELATQDPKDARARELANAASAVQAER